MTGRRGSSVIEVLTAAVLLAIVVVSVDVAFLRVRRVDHEMHARAGQVAAMRRAMAYWSAVPSAGLPSGGATLCDTLTVTVRVASCAAAATAGPQVVRLTLSARALEGRPVRPDSAVLERRTGS